VYCFRNCVTGFVKNRPSHFDSFLADSFNAPNNLVESTQERLSQITPRQVSSLIVGVKRLVQSYFKQNLIPLTKPIYMFAQGHLAVFGTRTNMGGQVRNKTARHYLAPTGLETKKNCKLRRNKNNFTRFFLYPCTTVRFS